MSKTIYINSYVKKDGTKVKAHYRNIESSMVGDLPDYRVDENGGIVLSGGVSIEDYPDTQKSGSVWETITDVIGTVLDTASSVCDIIEKLENAFKQSNTTVINTLKPKFESQMQNFKKSQLELEKRTQNTLERLSKTRDQQEYKELLKQYTQQKTLNQNLKDKIARIDYSAEHGNYSDVYKELKDYKSNFKEVAEKNRRERPLYTEKQKNKISASVPIPIPTPNFDLGSPHKYPVFQYASKGIIDLGTIALDYNNKISDAKELWHAASHDFTQSQDYIEKNGNLVYSVSELPSIDLQNKVSQKLQEQLGVSDALGVIFQPDSSLADSVSNSSEFHKYFKKHFKQFLDGNAIDKSSIHYSWKNDANLATAIGNADILYSFMDKNGDFYSILMDTYDFNKGENLLIDIARQIQEANLVRGYYSLIIIIVPIYKWLQWI